MSAGAELVRAQLGLAGNLRRQAEAERSAASEQLRQACLAAREEGLSVAAIAEAAGISRVAAYALLRAE